ncbi:SAM-dependent methyltransferase [Microbacterium barkeri]|uniref:SAM-dependent methyltransferase n=1 Tax=Microbacterium barkeri TaxID=33917 RepID=A0A9W6H4T2_9MICO|nr:TRAM domain-containing protein [Microbacterium barkeri]MDI6944135.1 TRAM domain-containing protein [Microbacterium barkeri]MDR6876704.1 tRNA/tmRNA/rRNA uracil-C5-methylase (TrmA/RlmC/RlmD family) [Microbacterium barkeri]GLJ62144.1 SAM-dependent methyltransferase [Microbacterium barkeri]
MQTGDVVDLEVTDIAHGGVFVARHEGRVVFVPDAVPGERVRARVAEVKKSFARAEALEVLDASEHRQPHIWAEADIARDPADRVGGADLGHIALAHQRELKAHVLRDAFARFADEKVDVVVAPAADGDETESADGTGWRTRVGLHVDADGRIGPFASRSHRVIEVAHHPLAVAEIESAALALQREKPGRVDLVRPADGRVRVIRRPDRRRTRGAQPAPAPEVVVERVGDRGFQVDAGGFWQVHRLAARTLHAAVARALDDIAPHGLDADAWHLDLYGGVGLFADALASAADGDARLTSVESAPRATAHARENLERHPRAEAVTARVERWLGALAADAEPADRDALRRGVTLLDPPRAGAGREVVDAVAALEPSAVVYVACDPVALARDVGLFRAHGYAPERLEAFDLFPNSHHVEALAVLRRA